jgi:hypothetical protein
MLLEINDDSLFPASFICHESEPTHKIKYYLPSMEEQADK